MCWAGGERTTTFGSANRLTAQIPAADVASAGESEVTVCNPAPGGGVSAPVVFTVNEPRPPTLEDPGSKRVDEETQLSFTLTATDPDIPANRLTFSISSGAADGMELHPVAGAFTWTPKEAQGPGDYSVSFTVSDGTFSDTKTVASTVTEANKPPVAVPDQAYTTVSTAVSIPVLLSDSDPDGDAVSIKAFTQGATGTVQAGIDGTTLIYNAAVGVPPTGSASENFTYTIADPVGHADSAQVTINISAENHDPTPKDDSATTSLGAPVTIDVLLNDGDPYGNALSIESYTRGSHGWVVWVGGGTLVYTTENGWWGIDTFIDTVSDGVGGTASATVTVTVTRTNGPPIASKGTVTTIWNKATSACPPGPIAANSSSIPTGTVTGCGRRNWWVGTSSTCRSPLSFRTAGTPCVPGVGRTTWTRARGTC